MNYSSIKTHDIADGRGVRVALFVSGCTHHCKGCMQPETWDFNAGEPFTEDIANQLIDACRPKYVEGITLLGGEPFELTNQTALVDFLQKFKAELPDKNVWCYTGYTYETDLLSDSSKVKGPATNEMLSLIDVLVDGEFIEEEKDITLKFRGSRNQRIIELKNLNKN